MTYFPPIFRLYPIDSHTLLQWSLDEPSQPFLSKGLNTVSALSREFNYGNIVENRTGLFSKAVDFTPPTALSSGDSDVQPPGNSFTISCWVMARTFPTDCVFVGKTFDVGGSGWNSPFWSISIEAGTDGSFITNYTVSGSPNTLTGPSTDPILLNQWVFLAITFDGVKINQYLNGNLVNQSSSINASIDWGNNGAWSIGGNVLSQTGGMDGLIDDIRIENIPRSQQYLQDQYKDSIGFYELPITSSFIPSNVGGLVLWLRSDKGVISNSNNFVSSIKDQSGFNSNCFQNANGDKPTIVKYLGKNGHPFIKFDTAVQWLSGEFNSSTTPLADLTFFLIAKFNDSTQRAAIALTDATLTASTGMAVSSQSGPDRFSIERFASGGTQTTSTSISLTDVQLYGATSDATMLQGYVNGSANGTPSGSTTGRYDIYKYVIGANDNTGSFEMNGEFYEYLLYNRVLEELEFNNISNYFLNKYKLAGAAPPPFSPTDIIGLLAWYDSDHTTLVTGNVDVLLDRSGLGNDGTAASSGQRPTVNSSDPQYNGHDSLNWSNTLSTAVPTPSIIFGAFTVVLVCKITSDPTYVMSDTIVDYTYSATGFSIYTPNRGGSGDSGYNHPYGAGWAKSEVPRILTRRFDGTHAGNILRLNGVQQSLTGVFMNDPGTNTDPTIFQTLSYLDGTASSDATFAAVLVYDNAISDDNLNSLETYLMNLYNLYDPSFIAGLTSWFRADLGVTLATLNVLIWKDQSLSAIDSTFVALNAAPQYDATGINNLPTITFDGSLSQSLVGASASALLGTTAITLFGIFQTSISSTQFIWGMQYNTYHYAMFINSDTSHPGQLFFFPQDASNMLISPVSYADGAPHCFIATYDSVSGDTALYVDNGTTPVITGIGSGTITSGGGDLNAIGSSTTTGANDRYFTGSMSELGSYDVALAAPDVLKLMNYLKSRAGI